MGPDGVMIEKEEANYKVTGALGKDKNTGVMYNGVLLKVCHSLSCYHAVVRASRCSETQFKVESL